MNQVVVMVECTSRKESYDFFEKLCETFNLFIFQRVRKQRYCSRPSERFEEHRENHSQRE